MSPKISVIIPVYNMEHYLERCLNSVIQNTYQNLEIICVDDGSIDKSLSILRDYASEDSRINVITKKNGGVSSARNTGMDMMTGEFLAFVDPDDYLHPQYFELLLRAYQQTACDMIVCGHQRVGELEEAPRKHKLINTEGNAAVITCREHFLNGTLRSFCWGRLIRKGCVSNLRFHEEIHFAEDAVFIGELWEENEKLTCCVLEEQLYYYYQREGSLVKMSTQKDQLNLIKLLLEKAAQSERNELIYFEQSLKRLLTCRYLAAHIYADCSIARECGSLLRFCIKRLVKSKQFTISRKVTYAAFAYIPRLYWLFRVKTDPGMLAWEKMERKRRRAR